jgi:hypothetical protein
VDGCLDQAPHFQNFVLQFVEFKNKGPHLRNLIPQNLLDERYQFRTSCAMSILAVRIHTDFRRVPDEMGWPLQKKRARNEQRHIYPSLSKRLLAVVWRQELPFWFSPKNAFRR